MNKILSNDFYNIEILAYGLVDYTIAASSTRAQSKQTSLCKKNHDWLQILCKHSIASSKPANVQNRKKTTSKSCYMLWVSIMKYIKLTTSSQRVQSFSIQARYWHFFHGKYLRLIVTRSNSINSKYIPSRQHIFWVQVQVFCTHEIIRLDLQITVESTSCYLVQIRFHFQEKRFSSPSFWLQLIFFYQRDVFVGKNTDFNNGLSKANPVFVQRRASELQVPYWS